MKFLGIDHPAIAAEDVEKSADWYCNVIGYEKWVSTDRPVWMLKAPDGTYLEIIPKDDTAKTGSTILIVFSDTSKSGFIKPSS